MENKTGTDNIHPFPPKLTCQERVSKYLSCISKINPSLNAFIETFSHQASEKAASIDKKIKRNQAGKLAGLCIGIKDNICYKNHLATAASKMLQNHVAVYSATAIERLEKQDAIITGRLNCDEFGMGSSNENSAYGACLHPLSKKHVPGGSSGGPAAAVSAQLCDAALGSDTGGSVRQPAAFCGVYGLKPSYGRVSRHGLIAYASSFDQIGIITRSLEMNAKILETIAGFDKFDATSSKKPVENYSRLKHPEQRQRIACFNETITHEILDPEIKSNISSLIKTLQKQGHKVEMIDFPLLKYLPSVYYVLASGEASSNLARYDGVRYGYRQQSNNDNDLEDLYKTSRSCGFGYEVKKRIMTGNFVLSSSYYHAWFEKAQKIRRKIFDDTMKIFLYYDFILSPTSPNSAFKINQLKKSLHMYLQDLYTVHANLTGIPAISIPAGTLQNRLPYGLQLSAPPFREKKLYGFSDYLSKIIN